MMKFKGCVNSNVSSRDFLYFFHNHNKLKNLLVWMKIPHFPGYLSDKNQIFMSMDIDTIEDIHDKFGTPRKLSSCE